MADEVTGTSDVVAGGRAMDHKIIGTTMPVLEVDPPAGRVGRRRGRRALVDDERDRAAHRGGRHGGREGRVRRGEARDRGRHALHDRVQRGRRHRAWSRSRRRCPVTSSRSSSTGRASTWFTAADTCAGCPSVTLEIGFQQKLGAGFFGGEGFILQQVSGTGSGVDRARRRGRRVRPARGRGVEGASRSRRVVRRLGRRSRSNA